VFGVSPGPSSSFTNISADRQLTFRRQGSCYGLETFTKPKKFVEAPQFKEQRRQSLLDLAIDDIDAPIAGLITSFSKLSHVYTLQSCYGHFLYPGQMDQQHIGSIPALNDATAITYRIAYVAICLENNPLGKELYEGLSHVPEIAPDHIQFGCAEWFWERHVNSYVLQVEPWREMIKDTAMIGYDEAIYIDKVRNEFFDRLNGLIQEQISIVTLDGH